MKDSTRKKISTPEATAKRLYTLKKLKDAWQVKSEMSAIGVNFNVLGKKINKMGNELYAKNKGLTAGAVQVYAERDKCFAKRDKCYAEAKLFWAKEIIEVYGEDVAIKWTPYGCLVNNVFYESRMNSK